MIRERPKCEAGHDGLPVLSLVEFAVSDDDEDLPFVVRDAVELVAERHTDGEGESHAQCAAGHVNAGWSVAHDVSL